MFRKLATVLAVSSILATSHSWALGLGEIDSKTKLNQPLNAQIKLLSSKGFDEGELKARIASFEAYNKFGLIRDASHSAFSFKTITLADGSKAVEVISKSPLREPYVNFLVELSWPQGRLLREYTILLDPPSFTKTTAVTPSVSQARPASVPRSQPVSRPISNQQVKSPNKVAQPKFDGDEWKVGRGETLWSIAKKVRPDGASVQQTLAALYRNNASAFINNDIDRLKAGAVLSVPSSSDTNQVSKSISYNDLRSRSSSTDSTPLDVRRNVEETVIDDSNKPTGGRLTIASVDESSLNEKGGSQIGEQVNANLQNENDSLKEQVETLKLRNEGLLKQLQEQLTKSEDATEQGVAVEDETLSVLTGSAEEKDGSVEEIASIGNQDEVTQDSSIINEQASNKQTTNDNAINDTAKNAVIAKPKPAEKQSFWQKDGFWTWLLAGLAALLALVGGAFFVRKQRADADSDISEANFRYNSPSPRVNEPVVEKQETTQTVDPLIEADILIARGKVAEVEDLLTEALDKEPENTEVRLKLMEVYASVGKEGRFSKLLDGLPADFDHDSEMGLKLASLTSLMGTDQETSLPSETDIFGVSDDALDEVENELRSAQDEATKEVEELAEETELEYEFETNEQQGELEDDNQNEAILDLSDELDEQLIDAIDEVEELSTPLEFEVESKPSNGEIQKEEESLLEDSLELKQDDSVDELEQIANDEPLIDDNVLEFSLSTDDTSEHEASDDEVETKLELAKAYFEMGDEESAQDVLLEVQKDGNSRQKREAEELIKKL